MHGHDRSVPMQPAARLTDLHVCPMVTGVVPHVGGPIVSPGAPTVLIGGLPAAR
ncbi:MAG: type VI secretion protein, partial [Xanthomonas perforans]|nr:type VI secretion protein [Xanthomonas perforans]